MLTKDPCLYDEIQRESGVKARETPYNTGINVP